MAGRPSLVVMEGDSCSEGHAIFFKREHIATYWRLFYRQTKLLFRDLPVPQLPQVLPLH